LLLALLLFCNLKNLSFSWVASPLSFRSLSVALMRDPHYLNLSGQAVIAGIPKAR
jgi:hypothetical protein